MSSGNAASKDNCIVSTEWLILICALLPIAALSGWWVARQNYRNNKSPQAVHPTYFKGLNFVLNEQPDKAIEVFIEMLDVDSDTIETHLALGNLFRRRGEIDRAIRFHQNLLARPTLNPEQHSLVLLELGTDYMLSGLLDRAENLFRELADAGDYALQANQKLLDIYQQGKDWNKAIKIAEKLAHMTGDKLNKIIAQFYCELADLERKQGNNNGARKLLRKAISSDKNSVRASIIEAEIAVKTNDLKQAIKLYKRVEKQDAEYISEIIAPLLQCYQQIDKMDEYMEYLEAVIEHNNSITALMTLTELISEGKGDEEAIRFLSGKLRKQPALAGIDKMIQYVASRSTGEVRAGLMVIKDLVGTLLEDKIAYKCEHCGFDAKLLHWQCLSCRNWNSMKPIHGI